MEPPTSRAGFGVGLLVGGVSGFLIAGFLAGLLGYLVVQKRSQDARKGWNLLPVVVASEDIAEDTVVTFDMISQRSVPEQFVTSSVVRPDSAKYIVNEKLQVAVQAGDLLLWSQFAGRKLKPTLVAARDVPIGARLSPEDLEEQDWDEARLTASFILSRDGPQALGRQVFAPFRKGDPILWTHLRADPGAVGQGP